MPAHCNCIGMHPHITSGLSTYTQPHTPHCTAHGMQAAVAGGALHLKSANNLTIINTSFLDNMVLVGVWGGLLQGLRFRSHTDVVLVIKSRIPIQFTTATCCHAGSWGERGGVLRHSQYDLHLRFSLLLQHGAWSEYQ